jgi:membrane protease YdiL (CAAX protease family)
VAKEHRPLSPHKRADHSDCTPPDNTLKHIAVSVPWPILVVALVLPVGGAIGYFVVADPDSPAFRVGYASSKVIQFALPLATLWVVDRNRLRSLRLSARGAGMGLALGFLTLGAILGLYFLVLKDGQLLSGVSEAVRAKVSGFGLDSPTGFVGLALAISLVHSFLEEYYWRWFVFSGVRAHLSLIWAITVSAAAFAAHHVVVLDVYFPGRFWSATMPFSIAVAIGGAMWAWLYERTGSLAGPWIAHTLADIGLMAVGFDLLYRC